MVIDLLTLNRSKKKKMNLHKIQIAHSFIRYET